MASPSDGRTTPTRRRQQKQPHPAEFSAHPIHRGARRQQHIGVDVELSLSASWMSSTKPLTDPNAPLLYDRPQALQINDTHLSLTCQSLARDTFVRTHRHAIVMMFVRPFVCLSVLNGRAL